jgi:hypothetical protein
LLASSRNDQNPKKKKKGELVRSLSDLFNEEQDNDNLDQLIEARNEQAKKEKAEKAKEKEKREEEPDSDLEIVDSSRSQEDDDEADDDGLREAIQESTREETPDDLLMTQHRSSQSFSSR